MNPARVEAAKSIKNAVGYEFKNGRLWNGPEGGPGLGPPQIEK